LSPAEGAGYAQLHDRLTTLDELPLTPIEPWLGAVMGCLNPLQALIEGILPPEAARTVAKM
jgi:hypothetical protein